MTYREINGVSFSIDKDMDFISYNALTEKNDDISNFKQTIDEFKIKLIDGIRNNDENLYNEIINITNRFDDMIEKVINLEKFPA